MDAAGDDRLDTGERTAPLPSDDVRALLERYGCWEPLWRVQDVRSGHDPDRQAPFTPGLKVF